MSTRLRPWRPRWNAALDAQAAELETVPPAALVEALEARDLWPPSAFRRRYVTACQTRPGDLLHDPAGTSGKAPPLQATSGLIGAMLRGSAAGAIAAREFARRGGDPVETNNVVAAMVIGGLAAGAVHVSEAASRRAVTDIPSRQVAMTLGRAAVDAETLALEAALALGRRQPGAPLWEPGVVVWRVAVGLTRETRWRGVGCRTEQTAAVMVARALRREGSAAPSLANDALLAVWRLGCALEAVARDHVVIVAPAYFPPVTPTNVLGAAS